MRQRRIKIAACLAALCVLGAGASAQDAPRAGAAGAPIALIGGTSGVLDVIVCEVLQGVHDESAATDVERQLRKLQALESGGIDLAREAARNYRTLRSRGYTVRKTIDCLIATACIRDGH